jgi:1-acyl-sn-glycerol-3-phosphate acyltransferase
VFFWFIHAVAVPLGRLLFRTSAYGTENIPLTGPVMLVSNHQSNLDPIFLSTGNPRRMYAMGKAELFVNPMSRWFYMHLGARPIKRGEPDRKGLKTILELYYQGNVVILFPEGGRNHEPGLGPLEPGVVFVADLADVIILPAGITGSGKIWPKGQKHPSFPKVTIRYGRPFMIDSIAPRTKGMTATEKKKRQEKILNYVREQIISLSDDAF